jgi:hypothetical protein
MFRWMTAPDVKTALKVQVLCDENEGGDQAIDQHAACQPV